MSIIACVIPNRNYGKWLGQAIDSVRGQTVKVDDIVVVDGESTDNSRDVAESWGVRFISHPRGDIGAARNVGIRSCSAEFILPLDSDDWLAPTFVEKCLEKMDAADVVTSAIRWTHNGWVQWPAEPITLERFLRGNLWFSCSLFRRAAWEAVGGYVEGVLTYEDWEFWIRLCEAGYRFAVVREVLFNYRQHADSDLHHTVGDPFSPDPVADAARRAYIIKTHGG